MPAVTCADVNGDHRGDVAVASVDPQTGEWIYDVSRIGGGR